MRVHHAVSRREVRVGIHVDLEDALIASSGRFDADAQALYAAEQMGIADEDALAESKMRVLAARAEGMDALAALVE